MSAAQVRRLTNPCRPTGRPITRLLRLVRLRLLISGGHGGPELTSAGAYFSKHQVGSFGELKDWATRCGPRPHCQVQVPSQAPGTRGRNDPGGVENLQQKIKHDSKRYPCGLHPDLQRSRSFDKKCIHQRSRGKHRKSQVLRAIDTDSCLGDAKSCSVDGFLFV